MQGDLNEAFRHAASRYSNVDFIETSSLIKSIREVNEELHLHFDRVVYRRLFDEIGVRYRRWTQKREKERDREREVDARAAERVP